MAGLLSSFFLSTIVSATLLGWLIAQMLKMLLVALRKNTWSLKGVMELGGMPSSHAALVTGLVASILFTEGITTTFVIALVLAMIVIRDAVGVRRQVGIHAKALNSILLKQNRIDEQEGHTPMQVLVGCIIGLLSAFIVVKFAYTAYFFLQVVYLMLPGIAANVAPVLAKRFHPGWDAPIDGNAKWKGKPLLGKNKTWRGLAAGLVLGTAVVIVQSLLYHFHPFQQLSLFPYNQVNPLIVGLVVSAFVLLADIAKSFAKRRASIAPGGNFFPWDQLDSTIGGLIGLTIFYVPFLEIIVTAFFSAIALSILLNGLKADLKW